MIFRSTFLITISGLLLVTIATEENDGFRQFMRSAKLYDLDVKVSTLCEHLRTDEADLRSDNETFLDLIIVIAYLLLYIK